MDDNELNSLAQRLTPLIAEYLLSTAVVVGVRYEADGTDRLSVGESVGLNDTYFNLNGGRISIGDFAFFGRGCSVITGTHDPTQTGQARLNGWRRFTENHINIGSGVWIGSNAVILGPCTIGDDAVIAAGAVVLPGTYEPGTLYAGVPAVAKKTLI